MGLRRKISRSLMIPGTGAKEAYHRKKPKEKAAQMDLFLCPNCGAERSSLMLRQQLLTVISTQSSRPFPCRLFLENSYLAVRSFTICNRKEATAKFLNGHTKNGSYQETSSIKRKLKKLTGAYFPYWRIDAELDGQLSELELL